MAAISETLGISPVSPAPIMNFGAVASQQLQQLGQQLRQDITTIQSNEQLKNLGSQLSGIDVKSDQFPGQMTEAISQNPLGAHTPGGISIINSLGAQHAAYLNSLNLQSKLNTQENIATGHDITRQSVADTGAQARTDVANTNAQSRSDIADTNAASRTDVANIKADVYGNRLYRLHPGERLIDGTGKMIDQVPVTEKTFKPIVVPKNAQVLGPDNSVIFNNTAPADQGQDKPASEADLIRSRDKASTDLQKAQAANAKAATAFSVDPKLADGYQATQKSVNDAQTELNNRNNELSAFRARKRKPDEPPIVGVDIPQGSPPPPQPALPQGDGGDEGTLPGDMGGVNLAPVARLGRQAPQASGKVKVRDRSGKQYWLPQAQLADALKSGYQQVQ